MSVQTSRDSAAEMYRGESGRQYHEGKRALNPKALSWVTGLRAAKFQPHVRPTDVVFELGVGTGWNLATLQCARRIGSDAADFLSEIVQAQGIDFIADSKEVPDESADVAICHHALEHMMDPAGTLRELHRILKPNGKLILHVPWERERRYAHHDPNEPNHHLFTWNAQTLGNLVSLCGYRLQSAGTRRYGYDRFAANRAAQLHLGEVGFRLLRGLLITLRPLREVELIATRH